MLEFFLFNQYFFVTLVYVCYISVCVGVAGFAMVVVYAKSGWQNNIVKCYIIDKKVICLMILLNVLFKTSMLLLKVPFKLSILLGSIWNVNFAIESSIL